MIKQITPNIKSPIALVDIADVDTFKTKPANFLYY